MIGSMNRDLSLRTSNAKPGSIYSSQDHHLPDMSDNNHYQNTNIASLYYNNHVQNESAQIPASNNHPNQLKRHGQVYHQYQNQQPEFGYIANFHQHSNAPIVMQNGPIPSHIQQFSQYSNNSSASSFGFVNNHPAPRSNSSGNDPSTKYYNYSPDNRAMTSPVVIGSATSPGISDTTMSLGYLFNDPNNIIPHNNSQVNPSSSGSEDILFNPRATSSASTGTAMSVHYNEDKASSTSPALLHTSASTSSSTSPIANNLTKSGKINKQGKTKRSRMGCLTCRGRKKRCCERKPTCAECERLGLKCNWPVPGMEYRNRSKHNKFVEDRNIVDTPFGKIKVLRGVVSRKD